MFESFVPVKKDEKKMKKVKRCEEQGRIYPVEVESSGNISKVCVHTCMYVYNVHVPGSCSCGMWGTCVYPGNTYPGIPVPGTVYYLFLF